MARDHVRHLVRQHGSKLGGIVGERHEAPRHVEVTARQRESVYRSRIEDRDAIAHLGPLGSGHKLGHCGRQQAFELGVFIGAVIGSKNAMVLPLRRGRRGDGLRLFGCLRECPWRPTGREQCRAAGGEKRRKDN